MDWFGVAKDFKKIRKIKLSIRCAQILEKVKWRDPARGKKIYWSKCRWRLSPMHFQWSWTTSILGNVITLHDNGMEIINQKTLPANPPSQN